MTTREFRRHLGGCPKRAADPGRLTGVLTAAERVALRRELRIAQAARSQFEILRILLGNDPEEKRRRENKHLMALLVEGV